ncbi:MAG TPA: EAL domain-containing protein [Mycobacteriales bacterium]|nr:EAL domain-containing protein [Mycobacteriales bacterium]
MTESLPPSPDRPRIVVIEDDAGYASLVLTALDDLGGAVTFEHVLTLEAALERVDDRDVVGVLSDLGLPDADGLEVVERLRARAPLSSLVVLTGREDEALAVEALRRGADDYVVKSEGAMRDLVRVVRHSIERSGHRRALQREVSRAEAVFEALGNAVAIFDADRRVIRVNPAARELLGDLTCDEMLQGRMPALLGRDGTPLADAERPSVRVFASGGRILDRDVCLRTATGEDIWIDVQASTFRDEHGHIDGAVLSIRDVSTRRALVELNREKSALLEAVGQAVVVTDADGLITFWNPAAERLYGWRADEVMGRPVAAVVPTAQSEEQLAAVRDDLLAGRSWTGDLVLRRRDGSMFDALSTEAPMADEDGRFIGAVTVTTDITGRKRAERAAQVLSSIATTSGDAILTKSLDGTIQSWNAGAEALYQYRADEVVGQSVSMLDPRGPGEVQQILATVCRGETVRIETVRRRKDGTDIVVQLTVSPMFDGAGAVVGASAIARDVSDRRQLEKELSQLALYDGLTGLPNRTLLHDRLQQAIANADRRRKPLAVLFCDLDHFKRVNDSRGHLIGDELLKVAATRISSAIRSGDTVARFGGDEFVVVAVDTGRVEAEALARRIGAALQEPMIIDGRHHAVTASLGIAVTPPLPADANDLLRHADAAMYNAKNAGRATSRTFDAGMLAETSARQHLTDDLRQMLDADRLEIHYQPQIDLTTGALVGLEALLRWHDPAHGWVSPNVFVPLAEDAGFAIDLDDWALQRACKDTGRLRRLGVLPEKARVAVNRSVRSLTDDLPSRVADAARRARLPLEALELEVTETALMTDLTLATRTLGALQSRGVGVALDDFGTGYSSLVYVRQLPITTLKIDRSFVDHIVDEADDLAIATSVIDLGRRLQLSTVAEGVETVDQLAMLKRLGCRSAQGFLWAPALPLDDLIRTLKQNGGRWAIEADVPDSPRSRPRMGDALTNEHGLHRLLELHGDGASLMTIAAALNAEGFASPGGARWHHRAVARALADAIPRQRQAGGVRR